MINILILSAGTRNKIIQYFKKALTDPFNNRVGNVIAADKSNLAPAMYEADKFYQVPGITDERYIEEVLNICKKENITGVLSLIDPELALIAQYEKEFNEMGVTVVGSSYDLCELSLNKMKMYQWLIKHGYRTAKSYADKESFKSDFEKERISYPVFVKPICGSASISSKKVYDWESVELFFSCNEKLMVQEYLNGQEIGADVYIDILTGEIISIFTKRKIAMRAGETDKAVSFIDLKLFDLIEKFVKEAGFRGQIDIDIFELDGVYYILEVNPRFGGGYPLAYECGCDHMKMIVENLAGRKNQKKIGKYKESVYMMKYNEVYIKEINE